MSDRIMEILTNMWAVFALSLVFALEDDRESFFSQWKRGLRIWRDFLFSALVDLACLPISTIRSAFGLPRMYRIRLKRRVIEVEAPSGFYNPSSRELLHALDDEELRELKNQQAEVWVPTKLTSWRDTEFLLNCCSMAKRAAELLTERRQRGI